MTKANLKNILTAVRDMINRSRIAYKDYLGEETVTETKVLVDGTLSETYSPLILKDPSFTGFVVGEEYKVTIDGTTQTLTAISNSGVGVITNATDLDNLGENYFIVDFFDNQVMGEAGGTYIGKTISISQTKTTTTKKYDIKKVPQELIPDTIARSADVAKVKTKAYDAFNKANAAQSATDAAKTAADNAQTAADNAQTAADNAQTAADNAQTAADNALGVAETKLGVSKIRTETNTVSIGDLFYQHTPKYFYDLNILNGSIITATSGSEVATGVWDGSYVIFDFRNTTLEIKLWPDGKTYEFSVRRNSISDLSISYQKVTEVKGLAYSMLDGAWLPPYVCMPFFYLVSSTKNGVSSGRKIFKITVDDTGTLSATEVTE